ncbi:hypothetical protein [Gracilimonas mengyeensis]|uniref:Uncharacterized protein n=1 Tax=Gracilimonas mengyeensis TaxID=1302730 RepID=A0A521B8Z7_9BACT|nr:hypothetical protein [Gracilimonas mengyeensis]SMO43564.1 hypothetical protein SAMN06265219_102105 [Gracilimonas mengyeensis]
MVAISVGLAFGLLALGVLTMFGAGIRSLALGKQDFKRIGMMAVPFVVFGISYGVFGEFAKSAIFTAALMMAAMILSIAFTGLRGTFKF